MGLPSIASELANKRFNRNVRAIVEEALNQPEFGDVSVIYTYASMSTSDHRNGRCTDFMIYYTERSLSFDQRVHLGNAILAYFKRHAVRLNVQGIIFNRHVYGFPETRELNTGPGPHETYRGPTGQARPYHGPNPHTDHVHVQFSGAPARSWLNKEERNPMPSPEELWDWDHATPPDYALKEDPKNTSWKPRSLLTEACQQAHEAGEKVDALEEKVDKLVSLLEGVMAAKPSDPAPTTDPVKPTKS